MPSTQACSLSSIAVLWGGTFIAALEALRHSKSRRDPQRLKARPSRSLLVSAQHVGPSARGQPRAAVPTWTFSSSNEQGAVHSGRRAWDGRGYRLRSSWHGQEQQVPPLRFPFPAGKRSFGRNDRVYWSCYLLLSFLIPDEERCLPPQQQGRRRAFGPRTAEGGCPHMIQISGGQGVGGDEAAVEVEVVVDHAFGGETVAGAGVGELGVGAAQGTVGIELAKNVG